MTTTIDISHSPISKEVCEVFSDLVFATDNKQLQRDWYISVKKYHLSIDDTTIDKITFNEEKASGQGAYTELTFKDSLFPMISTNLEKIFQLMKTYVLRIHNDATFDNLYSLTKPGGTCYKAMLPIYPTYGTAFVNKKTQSYYSAGEFELPRTGTAVIRPAILADVADRYVMALVLVQAII